MRRAYAVVPSISPRFDPRSRRGLFLWFDASTPAGADGATVPTWANNASHSSDATNGSDAAPTILRPKSKGMPSVHFTAASSQALTTGGSASFAQPNTYFIVCGNDTSQTGGGFWFGGTTREDFFQRGNGTGNYSTFAGGGTLDSGSTGAQTAPVVFTLTFNGASSVIRRSGTQLTSGDPGSNSMGLPMTIGRLLSGGLYIDGFISELIGYNRLCTDNEIKAIEQCLGAKWGAAV